MLTAASLRPSVIDDDRALETDIMRFMAILGFCLMAVFALIQSIPVSQQTGGVGLQTQPRLEQQVTQLQDQVRALLAQVAELQADMEQLQQSNNQQRVELETLAKQLSRSEAQLLQQLVSAQALMKTMQTLQEEQQALASAQSEVRRLQRQAYREQLRMETVERALAELNADATPVPSSAQDAMPAPAEIPAPQKPKSIEPSNTKPSLTMRYASTAAIERLIAGQRTVLYGISGNQAWRSTPQGDFVPTAKPEGPYALTESPGQRLMQRFRRGSGLLSASQVQWWVTLDQSIVSQISTHLEQHHDGQLVIQANGQVLHQPAGVPALLE